MLFRVNTTKQIPQVFSYSFLAVAYDFFFNSLSARVAILRLLIGYLKKAEKVIDIFFPDHFNW